MHQTVHPHPREGWAHLCVNALLRINVWTDGSATQKRFVLGIVCERPAGLVVEPNDRSGRNAAPHEPCGSAAAVGDFFGSEARAGKGVLAQGFF
jgi:hypothetical protein